MAPENGDPNDTPIPPEPRLPPPICDNDPPLPLPQPPPPIPPMPRKCEKTSIKDWKKKDKQLQKSIISTNYDEKTHMECCLDYFETDQDDFMNTLETNSTTPPELDTQPQPQPVPPRSVSLSEHLG